MLSILPMSLNNIGILL